MKEAKTVYEVRVRYDTKYPTPYSVEHVICTCDQKSAAEEIARNLGWKHNSSWQRLIESFDWVGDGSTGGEIFVHERKSARTYRDKIRQIKADYDNIVNELLQTPVPAISELARNGTSYGEYTKKRDKVMSYECVFDVLGIKHEKYKRTLKEW